MTVRLEGACTVRDMREGQPVVSGTTTVWQQIGKTVGAEAISLRVIEFATGLSRGILNESSDEVFYFLENLLHPDTQPARATIYIDGWSNEVKSQTGIYLAAGSTLTIENPAPAPIVFVSAQCPESHSAAEFVAPKTAPVDSRSKPRITPFVTLGQQRSIPTGDRWYRVLVDHQVGSDQVTQFVGSIPEGRAPDHFHDYEEVLFILRGQGRLWAGASNTQIKPGSCIYLPKRQVHCVENTGAGELRLLGVFYPAGSPSVRYEV